MTPFVSMLKKRIWINYEELFTGSTPKKNDDLHHRFFICNQPKFIWA